MKTKRLKIDKIEKLYKDEWVLLINPIVSSATAIEGGEVVFHSKDREEVHRELPKVKGDKAIIFTGKIPEDAGVLL